MQKNFSGEKHIKAENVERNLSGGVKLERESVKR
jgi:hypothetical protein